MPIKSWIIMLAAAVAVAAATPAVAAPCGGFTDVDDTVVGPLFCENVQWVKNRGVAAGCTASTYCPGDPVSRLQMAAFMNRLGTALTPVELAPVSAAPVAVDPTTNPVLCATPAPGFAVPDFPRRAYVTGAAHLSSPPVAIDVMANVLISTNNGATWTQIANSDHYGTLYAGSTPPQHVSLAPFGWVDIAVGQTVRFAIGLARFAGSGTSVTAGCNLSVQIGNRNSTTPPL